MYRFNRKNQLIESENHDGKNQFAYDRQGGIIEEKNPTGIRLFSYNSRHQQTKVETESGNVQENRYDAEGLRFELLENGKKTSFVFHNSELLHEKGDDNQNQTSYHLGVGIEAFQRGQQLSYYHRDEQLSTAFITGRDGEIQNSYFYDAFGAELEPDVQFQNRIRYTGQQYDELTGQYYLRARYYNPVLGRFMQGDVYQGDGLNLYVYCGNNSVVYYDPSGFDSTLDPREYIDPSNLIGLSATEKKNTPGIATGLFTSSMPVEGNTIRSSDSTRIAIPQEVAQKLVGNEFSSFDEFRGAIYEGISNSAYAAEFSSSNQTLMQSKRAPYAPNSLQTGDNYNQSKYNAHHIKPVEDGVMFTI